MSQIVKIVKTGLWLFAPLLFISNGTFDAAPKTANDTNSDYVLISSGDFNQKLNGTVDFETKVEMATNGTIFSTLELNLKNNNDDHGHSFGFLISKEKAPDGISIGTYKVSQKIDGFLNHFDGVFGFANITKLGEMPFFARNGRITIYHINDNVVHGNISINLKNANGKSITVKGNFTAAKNK